jgi:hypothetical protein
LNKVDPDNYCAAIRKLKLRLPGAGKARFFNFAPIDAGRLESETVEQIFFLGSYYAHCIRNQFFEIDGFKFVLSNGFLASHAYNLALLWMTSEGDQRMVRLRHNFKKFYAECALFQRNCLIGRALLIETLAYEQGVMQPIFAEKATDAFLNKKANMLASIMSDILNSHELCHFFIKRSPSTWEKEIGELYDGALGETYKNLRNTGDITNSIELMCDGYGAYSIWNAESSYQVEIPNLLTRLRLCAFGFLCFGELLSLQISAWYGAKQSAEEDLNINLASDKRTKAQFSIFRGRDAAMDRRVANILVLLEGEATKRGMSLYGEDSYFSLPHNSHQILREAFESFDDLTKNELAGLDGTDVGRRGIAQLLAESLHNHPLGVEHLLWRSKQFAVGGAALDP